MGKKTKKEIPFWAQCGHKKPVTRREILALTGGAFMATMASPSLLYALTAADCPAAKPAQGMIPFFSIHLSGGAAMSSNFLPMGKDGAPINDRSRMGLGRGEITVEKAFGGGTFAGDGVSKMLTGMKAKMGAAEAKTSFVGICVSSFDDSDKNKFDPTGLLLHTGYRGSYLPQINSLAGSSMKVQPAMVTPTTPLLVKSTADMENVLTLSGNMKKLSKNEKFQIGKLISSLNSSQLKKISRAPTSTNVKKVFECAGIKNEALLKSMGADVNPFVGGHKHRSRFATIWGRQTLYGSMAYNTLLEQSGPAHIALGGYDYHNGTRTNGDTKDLAAGELIGRLIATADYLQKPIFIMVSSDGAAGSPGSASKSAPWTTDFGRASSVYMLSYNPTKRPTTSKNQLGSMLDSQAVDESFILGKEPERAALGVFANYCSLIGRMDLLEKLPRPPFEAKELDHVLAFHKG